MRGLVIGSMGFPGIDEVIARHAMDADLIVAADAGAGLALRAGVTPSLVVGDMDSASRESVDALRHLGVEFMIFSPDKDVSDLDIALRECRHRGCESIRVIGVSGGRVDHELVAFGSVARCADLSPSLIGPGYRAVVLSPSGTAQTVVAGPGVTFSLLALLGDAVVSCTGAKWPLDHAPLTPLSSLGLSNLAECAQCLVVVWSGTVACIVWE